MSDYLEAAPYPLDRMADEADYAIVGPTDGRTRVLQTRAFPYSAVCHLERDLGDGNLAGCTGFLIAPTILLTAAHCIMSPIRARLGLPSVATRIRVTPGRASQYIAPYGSVWAQRWQVHPEFRKSPSSLTDVGLIFLERPFQPSPGYFQLWTPTTAELEHVRQTRLVHISGYPADKPKGQQWEHSERLDRVTDRNLFYSVDTCPGHSGAPVWVRRALNAMPEVVAVHTAGPRPHAGGAWGCRAGVPVAPAGQFNRGVRLTPALRHKINTGFSQ
jgi:V8-like Glu-specific endopeptidase